MPSNPIETNSFEKWIGNINEICGPFSASPTSHNFSGSIEKVGGALDMSRVNIQGANLFRTSKEIRQSEAPGYFCVFQANGSSLIEQIGTHCALATGDIALIDSTLPFSFSYQDSSQQLSLILPRSIVENMLNLSKIEPGIKINAQSHLANFANRLVLEAARHENLNDEEGAAVIDSLAMLLKPSILQNVCIIDPQDKVFRTASEFIKDNISNPDLTASIIAKSIGVSMRSLYRTFSYKSITLSDYMKQQRLDMCSKYIKAHHGRLSLTEVAYRFGFSSPSYFSTAFKKYYKISPSEYRKNCLKN